MDSSFMETMAEGVARVGIRIARFEFPYMRRERETGKGGAPDPGSALMQSWRDTIEKLGGGKRLVIGGKSLGGRIASTIPDETQYARPGAPWLSISSAWQARANAHAVSRAALYSHVDSPGNS
jgi:predicted alpha/beta-hydrolase family hydrolase